MSNFSKPWLFVPTVQRQVAFFHSVKAVGGGYPLRGALRVEIGDGVLTADLPTPGEVYLAPRLIQQLGDGKKTKDHSSLFTPDNRDPLPSRLS